MRVYHGVPTLKEIIIFLSERKYSFYNRQPLLAEIRGSSPSKRLYLLTKTNTRENSIYKTCTIVYRLRSKRVEHASAGRREGRVRFGEGGCLSKAAPRKGILKPPSPFDYAPPKKKKIIYVEQLPVEYSSLEYNGFSFQFSG